ncbi:MAG: class I SAM-dependent methyltransferase [Planctomycetota bacterium]
MNQNLEKIYDNRFSSSEREGKQKLWKCMVDAYLQRFFGNDATILDIGCGLCEFINAIKGKKKYAYDVEGAFKKFAGPDTEFIQAEPGRPIPLADRTCDRAFASNFFEHLLTRNDVEFILREAYRILKPGGRIVAIQPNIALTGGAYWDFFDHILPFTDKGLLEAMEMVGFRKHYVKRRFLPYTTKGKSYGQTFMLRLYLAVPVFHWIFGKQSLIIAEKPND